MCVGWRDASVDFDHHHYLRGHLSALQEHQITVTINSSDRYFPAVCADRPADRAALELQVTEVKTQQHRPSICRSGCLQYTDNTF